MFKFYEKVDLVEKLALVPQNSFFNDPSTSYLTLVENFCMSVILTNLSV